MTILIPNYAMIDFMEIINAYGGFLSLRKSVKDFQINKFAVSAFRTSLESYADDPYSWQARELGVKTGFDESEIDELTEKFKSGMYRQKSVLTNEMIDAEKFFKSLKHQFIRKYPELKDELVESLLVYNESRVAKLEAHNRKEDQLIKLSVRFTGMLRRHGYSEDVSSVAYNSLRISVESRFNDRRNDKYNFEHIWNKIAAMKRTNKPIVLDKKEIMHIAEYLEKFVSHVTDEDIENARRSASKTSDASKNSFEDKKVIAHQIVSEFFDRDKKLLSDYQEIVKSLKQYL